MELSDFDYDLPESLIAQKPASPRDHSRLMTLSEKSIEHKRFDDILDYLKEEDVLVVNETKVSVSKIVGKKETGSPCELVVEEQEGKGCKCRIKTKHPHKGAVLVFGRYKGKITKQEGDIFYVSFEDNVRKILDDIGVLPTPPYIKEKLKRNSQYQTIYSRKEGSVAAPTAGLHFTKRLMGRIKKKKVKIAKVRLNVGFGTFLPVRDISRKKLHSEYFEIDKKNADMINKRKGRLCAVGTTSIRALESSSEKGRVFPGRSYTDIFIKPGYRFNMGYDMMITNFHLPRSTLLMLVSAFIGRERILYAYREAVRNRYRFFSFGDAMLLIR